MSRTVVIAIGGNALIRVGQEGTYEQQRAHAEELAAQVDAILRAGWHVVIVHGNGPQVGNLAVQQRQAADLLPPQPLFQLGAMTQGELGSLICLALRSHAGATSAGAVAIVTHTRVAHDDAAFDEPTKPIGPYLDAAGMRRAEEQGWVVREDPVRGHRRVVPSPQPLEILESEAIGVLAERGFIVVAAGGGGVPVVRDGERVEGVEAVIDKDYTAARLASALDAEALVLLTGVDAVRLDYGTPAERIVARLGLDEAEEHLAAGQFPEGSMGPKVRAAVRFLRAGGRVAAITTPALTEAALEGRAGTQVLSVPDRVAS